MRLQSNEKDRLEALTRLRILDSPPDGTYDEMTSLAAKIFGVPVAIISLVDHDRIWFKSGFGINAQQIDRDPGLCASAILSEEIYLVEDARNDPRCLTNPLVAGEFGLQFYAAAPLTTTDGYNIGTFCILDRLKRFINEEQKEILAQMARIVMQEFEFRMNARELVMEYESKLNTNK